MSALLEVENLTVRFSGVLAVDDFSLEAPLGQITGLIGPNGAGKTTTFNGCSGLLKPTAGTIKLHGRDISHQSPAVRARTRRAWSASARCCNPIPPSPSMPASR